MSEEAQRSGDFEQPDEGLIEQIMERRSDSDFMERLRTRMAEDGVILSRLDADHQCRFPRPNTAGFPVNQCLDCGGWIIAAPDIFARNEVSDD